MEILRTSKRILFILLSLIGFISVVFLYMGYVHHKFVLEVLVKEEEDLASKVYMNTFKHITSHYELIANSILMNKQVIDAFENGDREALQNITKLIYDKLKTENKYLEIMHFHTKDTKSFLRVHKPSKYGDDLSDIRHMINYVNDTKIKQIGLEVGRYGIHYRIALPVFNLENKYLGAFELGIDIKYILNMFDIDYDLKSILLINKELLTVLDKKDIIYKEFSKNYYILQQKSINNKICENVTTDILLEDYILTYTDKKDRLIINVKDLKSVMGKDIGKMLLVKDMSFYTDKIALIRNITVGSAILLMLISLYLLKRIFSYYAKALHAYQSKLEIKNRTLSKLSHTDHLTKISNRKHIEKVLKKELKRANRYNLPLSVLILDIDNFKNVNDTYGHNIGDKVLRTIAKSVSDSIRESDYFGRWGGEEFIIVSTETSLENALILADKIRNTIEKLDFKEFDGVTCSIGVSQYDYSQSYENIIYCSDMALYKAKNSGKNKVVKYIK